MCVCVCIYAVLTSNFEIVQFSTNNTLLLHYWNGTHHDLLVLIPVNPRSEMTKSFPFLTYTLHQIWKNNIFAAKLTREMN